MDMWLFGIFTLNQHALRPVLPQPDASVHLCLAVLFVLSFTPPVVLAQGTEPTESDAPSLIDSTQSQTSELILDAAGWMDDFFNDDRITSEENKTRIRLGLSFGYSKNDGFEIKPNISGRIDLPHLSKKLNLLISATSKEDFNTDQNPLSSIPRHQESDNRDLTAGLQYFLQEGKKYNISTMFGGSFSYLYTGIRYRQSQNFNSWQGRFVNKFQYYTDDGFENTASYDLEHSFGDPMLFRATVTGEWLQERSGFPHSLVLRVYQTIDQENALLYEIGNYFDTEPSYMMTDLQLRLRFRQRFLRDWLVLEIAPQITFPEDHNRDVNPGVIIRFDADCGNLSGRDIFSGIFSF